MFGRAYLCRRVLLTGHTGFKGSWLALWLQTLGAEVTGVALPPESRPNHWELLGLDMPNLTLDIRDGGALLAAVRKAKPEIVFHLAAQPLVRKSYQDPLETWSTNVIGTANVLEACRQVAGIKAAVVVTTDKCYENREQARGYRETDHLGGHDPYSASKACTELLAASYRQAFFNLTDLPLLATARAGNVIGGGDWSTDRLIPDLVRAIGTGSALQVRSPNATRPWQHVLDSLSGYLILGQRLLIGDKSSACAWNFGPGPEANQPVENILNGLSGAWPELAWEHSAEQRPHEATLLYLDSTKAKQELHWQTAWSLEETLVATAQWYQAYACGEPLQSQIQLDRYIRSAVAAGLPWTSP